MREPEQTDWRYLANWSPRELQAVGEFARLTLPKLRRIQDIINLQIPLAFKLRNLEQKENAVWRLQRMDLIIAAAIDKKCFKE